MLTFTVDIVVLPVLPTRNKVLNLSRLPRQIVTNVFGGPGSRNRIENKAGTFTFYVF